MSYSSVWLLLCLVNETNVLRDSRSFYHRTLRTCNQQAKKKANEEAWAKKHHQGQQALDDSYQYCVNLNKDLGMHCSDFILPICVHL